MSLIIETITCPACESILQIETDNEKSLKKSKTKFERQHKGCKYAGKR